MTPNDEEAADAFFHAFADGTRRDILRRVLAEFEAVWRGRVAGIDALLADDPISDGFTPTPGAPPCPSST